MNLLGLLNLIFQVGDFAVKAIIHFANTDEGEKEWGDVVSAFVALGLFAPSDAAQGVTVSETGSEPQEFTLADIERLSETFNKAAEKTGVHPVAAPRIVRRPTRAAVNVDDIPF